DVLVLRVRVGALALARAPVAGQRGADRVKRGAGGRVNLVNGLGRRRRHLLTPLAKRDRGNLPRLREPLGRASRVIPHKATFSPHAAYRQRQRQEGRGVSYNGNRPGPAARSGTVAG